MRLAHLRHAAAIVAIAAQLALAHDDLRARVARVGPLRSHPKVGVCDNEHREVSLIHPFCDSWAAVTAWEGWDVRTIRVGGDPTVCGQVVAVEEDAAANSMEEPRHTNLPTKKVRLNMRHLEI